MKAGMDVKVAILDVETSSLEADGGIIVGAGLMPEEGSAEYFQVKRTADEKQVLTKLANRLKSCDVIVTWNGRSFDIPFITTRLLKHGMDPRVITGRRHIDLNEVVRSRLKLTFTYLDHVCDFFSIEKKKGTMGMEVPQLYVKAMEGDKRSLEVIKEHCLDDLRVTRRVYERLKPLLEGYLSG